MFCVSGYVILWVGFFFGDDVFFYQQVSYALVGGGAVAEGYLEGVPGEVWVCGYELYCVVFFVVVDTDSL